MTKGFYNSFRAKESSNPVGLFFNTAYTVAGMVVGIGVGLTVADFLWKIDAAITRKFTWLHLN